jgi:hypothetical protein
MADKKISELLNNTPLTGEEPIPMVQNNSTVKASVNTIVNGLSEDLTLKTGTVQAAADVDSLFLKSDPSGESGGAIISLHSNDSDTSGQIYYKGNQHIFNTTGDTRLLTLNQNGASIGDEDPQDPDGNELLTRVEIESLVENQIQAEQSSDLSENGYQILPSGLIMQWGTTARDQDNTGDPATTGILVEFPIEFPDKCLNIVTGMINAENNNPNMMTHARIITKKNFRMVYDTTDSGNSYMQGTWQAFGY